MYLYNRYWWQEKSDSELFEERITWIQSNYPSKESATNKCNEAVRGMVQRFPDLIVQVGFANGVYHCWCRNEGGLIYDPTYRQFDDSAEINYELVAERFLKKHEIELSTGAIFLDKDEA
jgi:hypothetical protein